MKNIIKLLLIICLLPAQFCLAQTRDSLMVASIIKEATENSQLEKLADELFNGIGPKVKPCIISRVDPFGRVLDHRRIVR